MEHQEGDACYTFVWKMPPFSSVTLAQYAAMRISPEEAAALIADYLNTKAFVFAEVYGELNGEIYRVYQVLELRGEKIPFPPTKRHLPTDTCPILGGFVDLDKVKWMALSRPKEKGIEPTQP